MAKECIEKEAAVKLFNGDNQSKYYQFEVISRLRSIPAADVRENVRGRWIKLSRCDKCSVCGWETGRYGSVSKFCPDCGAQLLGGAEDDMA